jgi:carbon storage regulator CsrA
MLVLSRKLGEKICIDDGIELEVLEISGNRVRLGISAPQDYRIARAERCFEPIGEPRKQSTNPLSRAGM